REAGAEARFHLLTHGRWQWLPAAVATVRNTARNMNGVAVANPLHDGTLMRGMWRRPGLLIHSPRSSHLRLRHPLEMRRLAFEVCRDVLTLGARRRRDGVRVWHGQWRQLRASQRTQSHRGCSDRTPWPAIDKLPLNDRATISRKFIERHRLFSRARQLLPLC